MAALFVSRKGAKAQSKREEENTRPGTLNKRFFFAIPLRLRAFA
jgi:hypothetical protein